MWVESTAIKNAIPWYQVRFECALLEFCSAGEGVSALRTLYDSPSLDLAGVPRLYILEHCQRRDSPLLVYTPSCCSSLLLVVHMFFILIRL